MNEQTMDEATVEAFGEQMVSVMSDAFIALQISIGHQVGLFDAMSELPPSTSQAIADASGLDERYVREWLGAMTTGRVTVYDPGERTYALPAEHAALLTRQAGADNMARLMPFVALLGNVEDQVIECFRRGGGVPYSEFPRFQELMAEDSAAIHDATLVDQTLPLVEGLTDRLTDGIDACDVGCGQGHAINLMAKAFPNSRLVGYDFSEEGVQAGRDEAKALGAQNAQFEVKDVTDLGVTEGYDLITAFDAIHDQAHPAQVLESIFRALRPDGVFLMVDIKASSNLEENMEIPWAPFLYSVSTLHCMTVSLALDGEGLGTAWGKQKACEMLADAGFRNVEVKEIEGDPFNYYYVAKKS